MSSFNQVKFLVPCLYILGNLMWLYLPQSRLSNAGIKYVLCGRTVRQHSLSSFDQCSLGSRDRVVGIATRLMGWKVRGSNEYISALPLRILRSVLILFSH
jgi:hypothetical protein